MDYSSTINESEDAVGASPWGNSPTSSPRNNRTGFGTIAADSPPFGFNPVPSNGLNQDPTAPEGFQRPGTATTASVTDGETDASTTLDQTSQPQSTAAASSQYEPLPEAAISEGAGQSAGQDERLQKNDQARRPAQPQFRLQAKITGLERTGKKDPILRFDVHVSQYRHFIISIS